MGKVTSIQTTPRRPILITKLYRFIFVSFEVIFWLQHSLCFQIQLLFASNLAINFIRNWTDVFYASHKVYEYGDEEEIWIAVFFHQAAWLWWPMNLADVDNVVIGWSGGRPESTIAMTISCGPLRERYASNLIWPRAFPLARSFASPVSICSATGAFSGENAQFIIYSSCKATLSPSPAGKKKRKPLDREPSTKAGDKIFARIDCSFYLERFQSLWLIVYWRQLIIPDRLFISYQNNFSQIHN